MSAKLEQFPRLGWKNKRAWNLLGRAKPFLLDCREGLYFVQGGVTATPIDEEGRPIGQTVKAATLLDPDKRPRGGGR